MTRRFVVTIMAALGLAGCAAEPVAVGSKVSDENRVVAEIMAQVLEDAGVRVERRFALGDSPETFGATRRGQVDLYPEYTGTALGLLGAPRTLDAPSALERARVEFAPLGLRFLEPFGYTSGYVVVVSRELMRSERLSTVSDLAAVAGGLRLGVARAFADRPSDGLRPFLDRFGLDFEEIVVVDDTERIDLYDRLLDDRIDVVVGFSTDPELGDYGLVALESDRPFFPAYDAVPLVRQAALEREPRIGVALDVLAGRLDDEAIVELVRQVQIFGRAPEAVAAEALADLGIERAVRPVDLPAFGIALEPDQAEHPESVRVLRAVREAVVGREVRLVPERNPATAVLERRARVAQVPSISLVEFTEDDIVRARDLEVVAVTGTSYLHALARADGPPRLSAASRIASGPVASASWKLAQVVANSVEPALEVVVIESARAEDVARAVVEGRADAGVVVGPRRHSGVARALEEHPSLALVDAVQWWQGSQRLALPFLREAILPPEDAASGEAPETVAMQTVLAGPAPSPGRVIGVMGPSTFVDAARPLAARTVRSIHTALGAMPDVNPHLRASNALRERPSGIDRPGLGEPTEAVLTVAILAFLALAVGLFVRSPE